MGKQRAPISVRIAGITFAAESIAPLTLTNSLAILNSRIKDPMANQPATSPGSTAPLLTSKVKCEALAGRVYEAIKEAILDLKLAPGARVNMDQLARELGVSISPIREALIRLTGERLVVFKSYSGYAVTPLPDKKSLLDLVDARLLMESHAATHRCAAS